MPNIPRFAILLALIFSSFASPAAAATHRRATPITLATIAGYASQIAGQPVGIVCEADATFPDGLDGYTVGDGTAVLPIVHVPRSTCTAAERVLFEDRHSAVYFTFNHQRADLDAGSALATILHETFHIALNSSDEGQVECASFENRWAFVKQFRLPAWIASRDLAGMAWNHAHADPAYRSVC